MYMLDVYSCSAAVAYISRVNMFFYCLLIVNNVIY